MRGTNTTLSLRDLLYAAGMAIATLIAYSITTNGLSSFVGQDNDLMGGMWAAVATVFVFRETRHNSWSAGIARLFATCVSFALCLCYLLIFPFSIIGMMALVAFGTVIMALLDRREGIITTAITTVVVMGVATISVDTPWHQPLLRLVDTVIGIVTGVAFRLLVHAPLLRLLGEPVQ
jgi:uncharacterized membrane protein YgaE (UPF0421/DUF939 family)